MHGLRWRHVRGLFLLALLACSSRAARGEDAPGSQRAGAPRQRLKDALPGLSDLSPPEVTGVDDANQDAKPSGARPSTGGGSQEELRRSKPPTTRVTNLDRAAARSKSAEQGSSGIEARPLQFHGVQPGVTTQEDVRRLWGEPLESDEKDGVLHQSYELAPFRQVRITCYKGKVLKLEIALQNPFPIASVAERLELTEIQPVPIMNDQGDMLGQVYPERAVVMYVNSKASSEQGEPRVDQITFEELDPLIFARRAEWRLSEDLAGCLADAAQALALDSQCARALDLRAQALESIGRFDEASQASQQALELEPENLLIRLTHARVLGALAREQEAIAIAKSVAEESDHRPEIKARALCQWADLVSAGAERDFAQAAKMHMEAIQIAQPLLNHKRVEVRKAARRVLIEAHLGMASDVAWGFWKAKEKVVPRWLERAAELTRQAANEDGIDPAFEIRVYQRALGALAGMQGALDPADWAEGAERAGKALIESAGDDLQTQRLEWELGLALYDAVQAWHQRQDNDRVLKFGEMAAHYLEQGAGTRQPRPEDSYLMGRLYYRLGSVHAVGQEQHAQAVPWFDKAVPLLETELGAEQAPEVGSQGETLVSIAVSYWAVGRQDDAVRLMSKGAGLMERAVADGLLDGQALSVPYANLAAMHEHLGDTARAKSYTQMAARLESDATLRR